MHTTSLRARETNGQECNGVKSVKSSTEGEKEKERKREGEKKRRREEEKRRREKSEEKINDIMTHSLSRSRSIAGAHVQAVEQSV